MFEPGDELVLIAPTEGAEIAKYLTQGNHYICRDFIPAGSGQCPVCSVAAPCDLVLLEGYEDITYMDFVLPIAAGLEINLGKQHVYGFPAAFFRKVDKRKDLIERLRAVKEPTGGEQWDNRKGRVRKPEKVDG